MRAKAEVSVSCTFVFRYRVYFISFELDPVLAPKGQPGTTCSITTSCGRN